MRADREQVRPRDVARGGQRLRGAVAGRDEGERKGAALLVQIHEQLASIRREAPGVTLRQYPLRRCLDVEEGVAERDESLVRRDRELVALHLPGVRHHRVDIGWVVRIDANDVVLGRRYDSRDGEVQLVRYRPDIS